MPEAVRVAGAHLDGRRHGGSPLTTVPPHLDQPIASLRCEASLSKGVAAVNSIHSVSLVRRKGCGAYFDNHSLARSERAVIPQRAPLLISERAMSKCLSMRGPTTNNKPQLWNAIPERGLHKID